MDNLDEYKQATPEVNESNEKETPQFFKTMANTYKLIKDEDFALKVCTLEGDESVSTVSMDLAISWLEVADEINETEFLLDFVTINNILLKRAND